jgi:CheY-like chemotaxis protein
MAAASATRELGSAQTFHHPDGQRRRVLYAEDQATARVVTTALLERMGFEVEAVEDGELALELARVNSYDVILLDIEMPVMDGVTAARSIRAKDGPCRETPILALSAFLADSTEHSAWRDAFDSALPKPANSNELQNAMRLALQSRKPAEKPAVAVQHWRMLASQLPAGVLQNLKAAAAKELDHLILAHASCMEAGDVQTAQHCRRAMKSIAASFEIMELLKLLSGDEKSASAPESRDMLAITHLWQAA